MQRRNQTTPFFCLSHPFFGSSFFWFCVGRFEEPRRLRGARAFARNRRRQRRRRRRCRAKTKKPGDVLLSHIVTHAVPSTQKSLTSDFGMGSGVGSSLISPARLKEAIKIRHQPHTLSSGEGRCGAFRSKGAGR